MPYQYFLRFMRNKSMGRLMISYWNITLWSYSTIHASITTYGEWGHCDQTSTYSCHSCQYRILAAIRRASLSSIIFVHDLSLMSPLILRAVSLELSDWLQKYWRMDRSPFYALLLLFFTIYVFKATLCYHRLRPVNSWEPKVTRASWSKTTICCNHRVNYNSRPRSQRNPLPSCSTSNA